MKSFIFCWLIFILAIQAEAAVNQTVNPDVTKPKTGIDGYFFIGAELLTFIDETSYPAIGVSKNRIQFSKDGTIQEIKLNSPIGLKFKPCLSDEFVRIEDPSISYSNTAAARAELRRWSELSYSQSASDGEISDLRTSIPGTPTEELVSQEQEYRELMENQIDEDRMHEDSVVDTVNLKFTLSPTADMKDVYLACGISYDLPKGKSKEVQRGSRMAVHYLGNLSKGSPETFRIRKTFDRFKPVKVKCEFFFFNKEAEPIAHSFSRKLRPLTSDEVIEVRKLLTNSQL